MRILSSLCPCKCLCEQLAGSLTYKEIQSVMSGQMLFIFKKKEKEERKKEASLRKPFQISKLETKGNRMGICEAPPR